MCLEYNIIKNIHIKIIFKQFLLPFYFNKLVFAVATDYNNTTENITGIIIIIKYWCTLLDFEIFLYIPSSVLIFYFNNNVWYKNV